MKIAGCLFLCRLLFKQANNLPVENIQYQPVEETKMREVLRTLRFLIPPEMLDNKGV
jgi:hypothetical protein